MPTQSKHDLHWRTQTHTRMQTDWSDYLEGGTGRAHVDFMNKALEVEGVATPQGSQDTLKEMNASGNFKHIAVTYDRTSLNYKFKLQDHGWSFITSSGYFAKKATLALAAAG